MKSVRNTKSKPAASARRGTGGHGQAVRTAGERAQHLDAFKKRTRRPGKGVGLANEPRPGLGTRAVEPDIQRKEGAPLKPWRARAAKAAKTYQPPRPEPQEEPDDERLQAEERSTGMSGQSAGT